MIKHVLGPNWISCPLGIKLLLSLVKGSKVDFEKYNQIGCRLEKKTECYYKSKLFSKSKKIGNILLGSEAKIDENPLDALAQWAADKKNKNFKQDLKETDITIANVSSFKSTWKASDGSMMKVYNSFNYTQDVKYEARLLEIPMQEDFKFIIIVPNESDVLQGLFMKLTRDGLDSAVRSIQPIFIASSEINAPSIKICSETAVKMISRLDAAVRSIQPIFIASSEINAPSIKICSETAVKMDSGIENILLMEFGSVDVDDKGVNIEVFSYISKANEKHHAISQVSDHTFFFALVHEDMPIFTGQFCPDK